jgi:hypothetical protein
MCRSRPRRMIEAFLSGKRAERTGDDEEVR